MFPVRCYTCNATIAHQHPLYTAGLLRGEAKCDMLDQLKVRRMCCRRMFFSHVDLTSQQMHLGNVDVDLDEGGTILKRYCKEVRVVSTD